MPNIAVFCASNDGARPEYSAAAAALGGAIVERGFGLVYGGASVGLMGTVADAALRSGGHVIGVFPEAMKRQEIVHPGVDLRMVGSMHERKASMTDLSQGFVVLPGGLGTLEEMFEVLTWAHLSIHDKPVALLNVAGYWDGLLSFLDHAVQEKMIKARTRALVQVCDHPGTAVDLVATHANEPTDTRSLFQET